MDFSDPITRQYLFAGAAVILGLSGWLLPDRYNILKMKGSYARHMSEGEKIKLARILGAIFIVLSFVIAIGTMLLGDVEL